MECRRRSSATRQISSMVLSKVDEDDLDLNNTIKEIGKVAELGRRTPPLRSSPCQGDLSYSQANQTSTTTTYSKRTIGRLGLFLKTRVNVRDSDAGIIFR